MDVLPEEDEDIEAATLANIELVFDIADAEGLQAAIFHFLLFERHWCNVVGIQQYQKILIDWGVQQRAYKETRGGMSAQLVLVSDVDWDVGDTYRLHVNAAGEEMVVDHSPVWDPISAEITVIKKSEGLVVEECIPFTHRFFGEHESWWSRNRPPRGSAGWIPVYRQSEDELPRWYRRRELKNRRVND
jgi:hypothetical protein